MLMSMIGLSTSAHDIEVKNADGKTIYYNYINKKTELEVTYRGSSYSSHEYTGNVVIPESVTYNNKTYSVTSIGFDAFCGCSGLTSVEIPNSIRTIGQYAFQNCTGLKTIYLPSSVTSIESHAFENCSNIESAKLSLGITSMGSLSFKGCSSLSNMEIPSSVTTLGKDIFANCPNLTEVTINSNDIVSSTYSSGNSLANIFGTQVQKYILGEDVKSIGSYAFSGCTDMPSMTLPSSIKSIGSFAFQSCTKLNSIKLPSSGMESIGASAFSGCSVLSAIEIPYSITSIGSDAFKGCTSIQKVIARELDAWCKIDFGNEYANPLNLSGHLYSSEKNEITELIIPNGVTQISKYAFYGGNNITSCHIPNTVTSVQPYAFYNCTSISSVSLGNSVKTIGEKAFYNCQSIDVINLPVSTTTIGSEAFSGCSLISLSINTGVTSIGYNAFANSKPIKTIWFTNTPPTGYTYAEGTVNYVSNEQYKSLTQKTTYPYLSSIFTLNGVKYVPVSPSERTCDAIDCLYDESSENVNIGEHISYNGVQLTVKNIKPYSLYQNKYAKNVQLALDGEVGKYAFYGCSNIKDINASNNGTIGEYAFANCVNVVNATISNKGDIYRSAFNGCTNFNIVNVSNNGSIGDSAFEGSSIQQSLVINNNGDLGNKSFAMILGDFDATIVNKGSIGNSAFYGSKGLSNAEIGNEVTKIEDKAFCDCTGLKTLSIGSSVGDIGRECFYNCTSVNSILSKAATPPTCGTQALDDINKWNCKLQVPANSLSLYQAADQWKEFFFIEGVTGIKTITGNNTSNKPIITSSYDINGKRFSQPQKGLNILRMSDGTTIKMVK